MGRARRGGLHRPLGNGNRRQNGRNFPHWSASFANDKSRSAIEINAGDQESHFSLLDEVRNTEQYRSSRADLKLRYAQIDFVSPDDASAGYEDPPASFQIGSTMKTEDACKAVPAQALEKMHIREIDTHKSWSSNSDLPVDECFLYRSDEPPATLHKLDATEGQVREQIFAIDTEPSQAPIITGFEPPMIRSRASSPTSSTSSEVITFRGRNPNRQCAKNEQTLSLIGKDSSAQDSWKITGSSSTTTEPPIPNIGNPHDRKSHKAQASEQASCGAGYPSHKIPPHTDRAQDNSLRIPRDGRSSLARRHSIRRKKDAEEELLADYIANIDDRDFFEMGNGTDLDPIARDLEAHESHSETGDSAAERQAIKLHHSRFRWDSSDLYDFDKLSTSDEILDTVDHVLSKRIRPSGPQYLIVWKGHTEDEARWIPHTSLGMHGACELIQRYEAQQEQASPPWNNVDGSSDSEEPSARETIEVIENFDIEEENSKRQKANMTDEQIARLLSKQEELGLGSDELVLLDGYDDREDEATEVHENLGLISSRTRSRIFHGKRKQGARSLLSAVTYADGLGQESYDGFDVMDHDRPSLRKQMKGRHANIPLELSDPELQASMLSAWDNDRSKKRIRKQAREEMRALGLLGRKNVLDTRAKYANGMSINEVKMEIRDFLIASNETLSLPPMDKKDRKLVHEIANVFNLKSKSLGNGISRFPVLYKTSRTTLYNEDALNVIETRMNRKRFLSRMDKRGNKSSTVLRHGAGRSGGFSKAAVSYMDGEVVGAAAPELGIENKGRAMLEKMGWSTGTALGASNNKGILQPVSHVVKTTKAGLG